MSISNGVRLDQFALINISGSDVVNAATGGFAELLVGGTFRASGAIFSSDVRIIGDLIIEGNQTIINESSSFVTNKLIYLNVPTTASAASDITADGGGVIISSSLNKELLWVSSSNDWYSNQSFRIVSGGSYRGTEANGNTVTLLTRDGIGPTVTSASFNVINSATTFNLNAPGTTTVTSPFVSFSADVFVGDDLSVRDVLTVGGTLLHNGVLLSTTGNAEIDGTLDVSGAVDLQNSLTVSGGIVNTGSLQTQGNLLLTGNQSTIGSASISGPVSLASTLAVAGNVAQTGSVNTLGNTNVSGSTTLTGSSYVSGGIYITQTNAPVALQVSGNTNLFGTTTVDNIVMTTTATASNGLYVSGNLVVTGEAIQFADAVFSGKTQYDGEVTYSGPVLYLNGFRFSADNTFDIGLAGIVFRRPRTGYFGTSVVIGTDTGTSGALRVSGSIGLANNTSILFRNVSSSADVTALTTTTANNVQVGGGNSAEVQVAPGGAATWRFATNGNILPVLNASYDIGSTTLAVRNLFVSGGIVGPGSSVSSSISSSFATTASFANTWRGGVVTTPVSVSNGGLQTNGSWTQLELLSAGTTARSYIGFDGTANFTNNARFDGGTWNRNETNSASLALLLHGPNNRFEFRTAAPGANPITWTTTLAVSQSRIDVVGNLTTTGNHIIGTDPGIGGALRVGGAVVGTSFESYLNSATEVNFFLRNANRRVYDFLTADGNFYGLFDGTAGATRFRYSIPDNRFEIYGTNPVLLNPGAVLGTDPGGSSLLRVGGPARFAAAAAGIVIGGTGGTLPSIYGNNTGEAVYAADVHRFFNKAASTEFWRITDTGVFQPLTNNLYDLGTSTARVATIFAQNVNVAGTITGNSLAGPLSNSIAFTSNFTGGPFNNSANATIDLSNTGVTPATYGSSAAVGVFTVDAKGRIVGASNSAISIDGSQITSGIIASSRLSGTYGISITGNAATATAVANSLSAGAFLTGGPYNGSAAVSLAVNATANNTINTVVSRDASGNFAAGAVTVNSITVNKVAGVSTITFPAATNDAGYIRHDEASADQARLRFVVSDNADQTDYFSFGSSGAQEQTIVYAGGGLITQGKGIFRSTGASTQVGGNEFAQLEINNANSGVAYISFHKENVYGANFGLDETNAFSTQGWSAGSGFTPLKTGNLTVTGAITATGDITAFFSDARLKTNIQAIVDPIGKLKMLDGVYYNWTEEALQMRNQTTNSREIGLLAQDVESVLPELVVSNADGYKTVKYDKLVAVLVEAVKAQQLQIDELRKRLG